jgi:hypothetical protein
VLSVVIRFAMPSFNMVLNPLGKEATHVVSVVSNRVEALKGIRFACRVCSPEPAGDSSMWICQL